MIEPHFRRLMTDSKIVLALKESMTPKFVVVVHFYCQSVVILARVCHICAFFVEDIVTLLDEMADRWV